MALGDQLIDDIIARIRERQPHTPDALRALENELRTKWDGQRCYASKAARDVLERARRPNPDAASGSQEPPL